MAASLMAGYAEFERQDGRWRHGHLGFGAQDLAQPTRSDKIRHWIPLPCPMVGRLPSIFGGRLTVGFLLDLASVCDSM